MGKPENWVHFNQYLLKSGRASHFIPKNLDEDAANELKDSLEEKDPNVERLRGITEDKRSSSFNDSPPGRS